MFYIYVLYGGNTSCILNFHLLGARDTGDFILLILSCHFFLSNLVLGLDVCQPCVYYSDLF